MRCHAPPAQADLRKRYGASPGTAVSGAKTTALLQYSVTPKRWPSIPNVPTIAESGIPGFDVLGWYGLVYPAGVPAPVIAKTSKALNQVVSSESVKKQLENIGALAVQSSPQEFGTMIGEEVARWREVSKAAGIEPQ